MEKARLGKKLTGEVVRLGSAMEGLRRRQQAAGGGSEFLNRKMARTGALLGEATRKAKAHGIAIGDAAKQHREFSRALDRSRSKLARLQRQEARRERQQYRRGLVSEALPTLGAAYAAARTIGGAMEIEEQEIHLRNVIVADDGDAEAAVRRARERAAAFARDPLECSTRKRGSGKARLVRPAVAMRKKQQRHPDLGIADYRRLPDVLGKPDFVVRRMPASPIWEEALSLRLNLVREVGGKTYQAMLKRYRNGSKVKLVTFFEVGEDYLRILNEEAPGRSAQTVAMTGWGCAW